MYQPSYEVQNIMMHQHYNRRQDAFLITDQISFLSSLPLNHLFFPDRHISFLKVFIFRIVLFSNSDCRSRLSHLSHLSIHPFILIDFLILMNQKRKSIIINLIYIFIRLKSCLLHPRMIISRRELIAVILVWHSHLWRAVKLSSHHLLILVQITEHGLCMNLEACPYLKSASQDQKQSLIRYWASTWITWYE